MKRFYIRPAVGRYKNPQTQKETNSIFLYKATEGFYHSDYHGGNHERRSTPGTAENIITTLKNQFQEKSLEVLIKTGNNLIEILKKDLPEILRISKKDNLIVCVVPRAKTSNSYSKQQLVFKMCVSLAVNEFENLIDGTDYIVRHTNTRTTHMNKSGHGGDGDLPYPGITKKTCAISDNVIRKDVLLIDDLYTETINIDEDAIQALIDKGANSVVFYSLGKTAPRN